MTDHPTLIFANQARPGMRLEDTYKSRFAHLEGIFTVTQVAQDAGTVTILGVRDDGSPYHCTCGPHVPWFLHDSGIELVADNDPREG